MIGNTFKFMREVKAEGSKITWPSIKDTRMMTLMVVVLVALVSVYLLMVDAALSTGVNFILGL